MIPPQAWSVTSCRHPNPCLMGPSITTDLPSALLCTHAGVEFDELSPPQQADAVAGALAVFARVEPSHKTRLVDLLKQQVGGF